jgi:hypothetical protein
MYAVVKELAVLCPTSAAVERIFSILEARFGKRQSRSLRDRIMLELRLAFHKRTVD